MFNKDIERSVEYHTDSAASTNRTLCRTLCFTTRTNPNPNIIWSEDDAPRARKPISKVERAQRKKASKTAAKSPRRNRN